jgi:hypothetical protein
VRKTLTIDVLLAALVAVGCLNLSARAQDSGENPSLGDVARKARQEKQTNEHAAPKHVLNEENLGPPGRRTYAYVCRPTPCSYLNVMLPPGSLYPGVVPLDGNPAHNVAVISAMLLQSSELQSAKTEFLVNSIARMYHAPIKFDFDEDTRIDQWRALLTHFTMTGRVEMHRGIALFVLVPNGAMGLACIYRDEVAGDASSVCDSVFNSAKVTVPEKFRPNSPLQDPDPPGDDDP